MIGAGIGVGSVWASYITALSRQPRPRRPKSAPTSGSASPSTEAIALFALHRRADRPLRLSSIVPVQALRTSSRRGSRHDRAADFAADRRSRGMPQFDLTSVPQPDLLAGGVLCRSLLHSLAKFVLPSIGRDDRKPRTRSRQTSTRPRKPTMQPVPAGVEQNKALAEARGRASGLIRGGLGGRRRGSDLGQAARGR